MTDKDKLNLLASRVCKNLITYQKSFRTFKEQAGLTPIENTHECVSGSVDKLGRLTRHVKHNLRNDPKDSFPKDAIESYAGLLAYIDLIVESFNVSEDELIDGIMAELMKSVKQHAKEK